MGGVRGRPAGAEKTRSVHARLPEPLHRRMVQRAQLEKLTESQLVREALQAYLDRELSQTQGAVRRFFTSDQEIADAVRRQRDRLGITSLQLAKRTNLPRQTVTDLESGRPVGTAATLAILDATHIHALALPGTPRQHVADDFDLDAHLADYAAGRLEHQR